MSVTVSSWGTDLSAYMLVANNIHHGELGAPGGDEGEASQK